MKSFLTAFFSILVLFGVLSSAGAQGGQVQVNTKMRVKIETETQKTPVFEAGGVKTKKIPYPRDWLEIEIEFKPEAAPRGATIPKLMFKYYVAIKGENGTQLVTGEVTYVNVIGDEDNFSCVYISPSTLGKITGDFRKFQPSSIAAIAVEIYYGGVLKGVENSDSRGNWWEQMAGSPGVLAKHETPFALLWLDRYADVEMKRN